MTTDPQVNLDFRMLFERAPGLYLVMDRDLRIVAATDAFLRETHTRREDIVGRYVFDVFPDNPEDPAADGRLHSLAALERVLRTGQTDAMAVQRHDVRKPESEGGGFEELYWSPAISPILDENGSVAYILHRVENVTEFILSKRTERHQAEVVQELRERTARMEADLYERSREVAESSLRLKLANAELEGRVSERVAELERATEALRRSDASYRDLVENVNSAIIRWNSDGKLTFCNEFALRFFGYNAEELIGQHVSILVPETESDGADLTGLVQAITDRPHDFAANINENVRKDGSRVWMNWTNRPLLDQEGRLTEILAVGSDVTEQMHSEQALRESEAKLRRFYDSGMFGVLYYDLDGSVTDANDAFLNMVGYTRDELQAGLIDWSQMTPPEYSDADTQGISRLKRYGVEIPHEKEYVRKDGSRVPILIGAATLDEARNRGMAFVLDITERKKSEEALRVHRQLLEAVVNSIPAQINLMRGSDLRIELVNPAYQALAPGKEMVGKTLNEVWPETGRDFLQLCRQVLETGEPFQAEDDLVTISEYPGGPTHRVLAENALREAETNKLEFYRRTILAASNGKLLICERDEIEAIPGDEIERWRLTDLPSLGRMRRESRLLAEQAGLGHDRAMSFMSCIVEAATNVIKHAGEGEARLSKNDKSLIFSVSDTGPGIGAMALPDVALVAGYSTAGTLGMGYKLMLQFADKVYLSTGPVGTTVAIEMFLDPPADTGQLLFPQVDGWEK